MTNIITATEALRMLGMGNKNGNGEFILKKAGIEIVARAPQGRGNSVFVSREQVEQLVEKTAAERKAKEERKAAVIETIVEKGKPTRFVPNAEILLRIEAKIDRLLILWGEK